MGRISHTHNVTMSINGCIIRGNSGILLLAYLYSAQAATTSLLSILKQRSVASAGQQRARGEPLPGAPRSARCSSRSSFMSGCAAPHPPSRRSLPERRRILYERLRTSPLATTFHSPIIDEPFPSAGGLLYSLL